MSYGQYSQNPYHTGPEQEAGGYQQENPYAQNQYEMQNYSTPAQQTALSQSEFLDRVSYLQDDISGLRQDVATIGHLHANVLSSTDEKAKQPLEQQTAETRIRNNRIKDEIKNLERDLAKTTDSSSRTLKQSRLQLLKDQFKNELQSYQRVENDFQHKYRDQIARQYRIVNPEASEAEVQQATEGNERVFQSALLNNRTNQAQSALGNVRARHNELKRIEETMSELAILFEQLATVVEQQEPVIQAAEDNAFNTTVNMDEGIKQTEKAKESAARARRLKWWCALVVLLIVLAIALGVGLGIGLAKNATS